MKVLKYRKRVEEEIAKNALWQEQRIFLLKEIAVNLYAVAEEISILNRRRNAN